MGLLITDTAAAPVRVTFDVDLVARVSALAAYHGIEKEFVRLAFSRDTTSDAPICRWRYRGLEVDLMPTDSKVLGFEQEHLKRGAKHGILITVNEVRRVASLIERAQWSGNS